MAKGPRKSLTVSHGPAVRLTTKLDDLVDLRGNFIELRLGQGPQAAVEELDFPAEIPLQEPRPRMSILIGADVLQKRKLSFYSVTAVSPKGKYAETDSCPG